MKNLKNIIKYINIYTMNLLERSVDKELFSVVYEGKYANL
jgi:hypothetical protein